MSNREDTLTVSQASHGNSADGVEPTVPAPMFSIVIPVYNHGHFVGAALDSVIAQTDPDWEIIAVNDGSTDDTPEVLEAYAGRDARIRVVHKSNGGASTALNVGVGKARGEWICWLSADDLFEPTKLAVHRKWIERNPDCRFFFSHFRYLNDDTGEITDPPMWRPVPENRWQVLEMLESNFVNAICTCVHRDAYAATGDFDSSMKYSQDYDMWLRVIAAFPGTYVDERLSIVRYHAAQYSVAQRSACVYDTGRICIRFLNGNAFPRLFPTMDLRDPAQARLALDHAIDAAANPHAFLYTVGVHTALIGRIIEWLLNDADVRQKPALRRFFLRRARHYARQFAGTDLGFIWKLAAAACAGTETPVEYCPISAAHTGMRHASRMAADEDSADLATFLARFEGGEVTERPSERLLQDREILLAPPAGCRLGEDGTEAHKATADLAREMTRLGGRTALAGLSRCPVGAVDGTWFVGAADDTKLGSVIDAVGRQDVFVAMDRADLSRRGRPERSLVCRPGEYGSADGVVRAILELSPLPPVERALRVVRRWFGCGPDGGRK